MTCQRDEDRELKEGVARDRPLRAVSCALVGDVADVVRIETLRSTPLIVDRATKAKLAFDRTFTWRHGLTESFPARLLPAIAHLCRLLSDATFRRLPTLGLVPRKIGGKEPVDLGVRHQASESSEAAL